MQASNWFEWRKKSLCCRSRYRCRRYDDDILNLHNRIYSSLFNGVLLRLNRFSMRVCGTIIHMHAIKAVPITLKISQWLVGFSLFIVNAIYTTREHTQSDAMSAAIMRTPPQPSHWTYISLSVCFIINFWRPFLQPFYALFIPLFQRCIHNSIFQRAPLASSFDLISIYIHTHTLLWCFFSSLDFFLSIRLTWTTAAVAHWKCQ